MAPRNTVPLDDGRGFLEGLIKSHARAVQRLLRYGRSAVAAALRGAEAKEARCLVRFPRHWAAVWVPAPLLRAGVEAVEPDSRTEKTSLVPSHELQLRTLSSSSW